MAYRIVIENGVIEPQPLDPGERFVNAGVNPLGHKADTPRRKEKT